MNLMGILTATLAIGISGLIIGILLGVAAEAFKVKVNEKEVAVRELLPGVNCGACGYTGCDGLAKAIAEGEAATNACPVGGDPVGKAVSEVMGVAAVDKEKEVAFVKCAGTCDKTTTKYKYHGLPDCNKATVVPGKGEKNCTYGCIGFGSCAKVCMFDAIEVVDGIAMVRKDKCVACGKCIDACPNNLIELVPDKAERLVRCNSNDKGKQVKESCSTGCIGCTICVKQCEFDAIEFKDSLAHIDYSKCTNCGKCKEKCPSKIIS